MSRLDDIEQAAARLSPTEKQEILLFLAASLRDSRRAVPEPRQFTREQLSAWLNEDEADLQWLREQR